MTVSAERTYSVGEAAVAVGLTTSALRWYEQEGLVRPVERDSVGRRRYRDSDISFLELLMKLRRTGMSVARMRRYTELIRAGEETFHERRLLLEAHRDGVLARIEALRADLEAVDYKINIYLAQEQS